MTCRFRPVSWPVRGRPGLHSRPYRRLPMRPFSVERTMNIPKTLSGLLVLTALAVACNPDGRSVGPDGPALAASGVGVPFSEGLASPTWQATAATLVAQNNLAPTV